MAVLGESYVDVEARTDKVAGQVIGAFDDAGKKAGHKFSDSVEDSGGGRLSASAKSMASGFAGAFIGAGGLSGAVSAFKGFTDAAAESAKISALTNQVLEATGGAAGITRDHIDKLTDSISNRTAVDDEAIQSGQNLLLQFTNLQNKAGEGNDIYDRTTKLMVDMAAKMGTDPVSAATKLGKALNEPGEGLSRLKKEGITFTEQQEEMIQAMADAGDTAGAQAAILDALEGKYKGAAEAQATGADRAKLALGNLQEEIGAKLIPVVEFLARALTNYLIPALGFIADNIVPIAAAVAGLAIGIGIVLLPAITAWATAAWAAAAAQIAAAAPAIALGLAIAAVGAAFVLAYQNIDGFRAVVDAVVGFVTGTVLPMFMTLAGFLVDNLGAAIGVAAGFVTDTLVPAFLNLVGFVRDNIIPIFTALVGFIRDNVVPIFQALVSFIVDQVLPIFLRLVDFYRDVLIFQINAVVAVFRDVLIPIFQAVISFIVDNIFPVIAEFVGVLGTIVEKVGGVAGDVKNFLFDILGYFVGLGTGIANFVKDVGTTLAGWVLDVWKLGGQVIDFITGIPGKIVDGFLTLAEALTSPFRTAFNAIADLWNNTVGKLSFSIPSWVPGIGGNGWDVPDIPKWYHTGGVVPGSGDVLSMLRGGEVVFTPDQMRVLGQVLSFGGTSDASKIEIHIHVGSFVGSPENVRELAVTSAQHVSRVLAGTKSTFNLRGNR